MAKIDEVQDAVQKLTEKVDNLNTSVKNLQYEQTGSGTSSVDLQPIYNTIKQLNSNQIAIAEQIKKVANEQNKIAEQLASSSASSQNSKNDLNDSNSTKGIIGYTAVIAVVFLVLTAVSFNLTMRRILSEQIDYAKRIYWNLEYGDRVHIPFFADEEQTSIFYKNQEEYERKTNPDKYNKPQVINQDQ